MLRLLPVLIALPTLVNAQFGFFPGFAPQQQQQFFQPQQQQNQFNNFFRGFQQFPVFTTTTTTVAPIIPIESVPNPDLERGNWGLPDPQNWPAGPDWNDPRNQETAEESPSAAVEQVTQIIEQPQYSPTLPPPTEASPAPTAAPVFFQTAPAPAAPVILATEPTVAFQPSFLPQEAAPAVAPAVLQPRMIPQPAVPLPATLVIPRVTRSRRLHPLRATPSPIIRPMRQRVLQSNDTPSIIPRRRAPVKKVPKTEVEVLSPDDVEEAAPRRSAGSFRRRAGA